MTTNEARQIQSPATIQPIITRNPINGRFSFEINRSARNKRVVGWDLNNRFERVNGTIDTLAAELGRGFATCGCLLKDGRRIKKQDYFDGIQMLVLDIDNKLPPKKKGESEITFSRSHEKHFSIQKALDHPFVREYASLVYTTPSHDPGPKGRDCFRIIFILPAIIKDMELASLMVRSLQSYFLKDGYLVDTGCKDPSRIYFGNSQATFPLKREVFLPEQFITTSIETLNQKKQREFDRAGKTKKPYLHPGADSGIDYSNVSSNDLESIIREALDYIDATSYDTWFRIGAALKSAESILGPTTAFNLYDRWSATCPSKYNPRETLSKWNSFQGSGITLGTLFSLATDGGFNKRRLKEFYRAQRVASGQIQRPQRDGKRYKALLDLLPSRVSLVKNYSLPRVQVTTSMREDIIKDTTTYETIFETSSKTAYLLRVEYENNPQAPRRQSIGGEDGTKEPLSSIAIARQTRGDEDAAQDSISSTGALVSLSRSKLQREEKEDGSFSSWKAVSKSDTVPPFFLAQAIKAIEEARTAGAEVNAVLVIEQPELALKFMENFKTPIISFSQLSKEDCRRLAYLCKQRKLTPIFIPSQLGVNQKEFFTRLDRLTNEFVALECPLILVREFSAEAVNQALGRIMNESYEELPEDHVLGANYQARSSEPVDGLWLDMADTFQAECQDQRNMLEQAFESSSNLAHARGEHPELNKKALTYAKELADSCLAYLRWDSRNRRWMAYNWREANIWAPVSHETVMRSVVMDFLDQQGVVLSINTINQITDTLKCLIEDVNWVDFGRYLPFENGVFDKETNTFLDHSPRFKLTWKLPHTYDQELQSLSREEMINRCRPIWDWLVESVRDPQIATLMIAYLGAIVRGYTELQKFLLCVGPPGSGKGTFLRLATALIGKQNTCSTTLTELSTNRFSMAKLVKAPLVLISEVEQWLKDVTVLKSLTGEDINSIERKGVQQEVGEDMEAQGLLLAAGERIPATTDTGGLQRRQITIPFVNVPKGRAVKNLISVRGNQLTGEFVPYLAPFFNLVLSFTKEEIKYLIQDTAQSVPQLNKYRMEAALSGSSLMQWIESSLYYMPPGKDDIPNLSIPTTQVGNLRSTPTGFLNAASWLYPNYRDFCSRNALTKIMGLAHFTEEVAHIFNNQLLLPIRVEERPKRFTGVGLRVYDKNWQIEDRSTARHPRIITELYARSLNTNPVAPMNPFPDLEQLYPEGFPWRQGDQDGSGGSGSPGGPCNPDNPGGSGSSGSPGGSTDPSGSGSSGGSGNPSSSGNSDDPGDPSGSPGLSGSTSGQLGSKDLPPGSSAHVVTDVMTCHDSALTQTPALSSLAMTFMTSELLRETCDGNEMLQEKITITESPQELEKSSKSRQVTAQQGFQSCPSHDKSEPGHDTPDQLAIFLDEASDPLEEETASPGHRSIPAVGEEDVSINQLQIQELIMPRAKKAQPNAPVESSTTSATNSAEPNSAPGNEAVPSSEMPTEPLDQKEVIDAVVSLAKTFHGEVIPPKDQTDEESIMIALGLIEGLVNGMSNPKPVKVQKGRIPEEVVNEFQSFVYEASKCGLNIIDLTREKIYVLRLIQKTSSWEGLWMIGGVSLVSGSKGTSYSIHLIPIASKALKYKFAADGDQVIACHKIDIHSFEQVAFARVQPIFLD